jgi:hypothetical protein
MPSDDVENPSENVGPVNRRDRRRSILATSNPQTDSLPIDCILVYNRNDDDGDNNDDGIENNNGSFMSPTERRKRFEDYLITKQRLILQHVVCRNKTYKIK